MSEPRTSDWAAAKAILPCGKLCGDDPDDVEALAHAFKDYRESLIDDVYPIFGILPRLWASGHRTAEQGGTWWLFDESGEGIASGRTFRELCVNIVLGGL